jgi:hypothetical protein
MDGKRIKLKDVTSNHLCNILKHINNNINIFNDRYGTVRTNRCLFNVTQELRLRKLNRIKMNDEGELF